MTTTIAPGTLMILYGPTGVHGPELTWIIQGKVTRESVAIVNPFSLLVRDYSALGFPGDYEQITDQAHKAYKQLRAGTDLSDWATHKLDPTQRYQVIVPIEPDDQLPGQSNIFEQLKESK